ncbi:variable surface protein Vir6-like [Plasmodium vivax]|uniref:Variable surface protein Vir6-like n=1 Tax=Plasmodium vivax (strain Salvador I) TaxID=126793 RepID=A5KCX1_PLAVS|nr:variable surface protein Vir6-like [Plasmodium vivax]EDL42798.1 variable surface protein Vir6-like [Plasmodium vivax]|eukprot:XP_001612589.1 variable surface protein Vir6-like [Plasmodium vivax Sal-1]
MKRQFVERINETSFNIISDVSDFEKSYPHNERKNLIRLPKVFTKLQKYLSNHAVFAAAGTYNGDATCNYINYLLYDGIRNENYGYCDEQTFNNFRDFVYDYNTSTRSHICINKLKHLDEHEFKKMNALYQLYEWYNKLTSTYLDKNGRCDAFGNIIAIYNKALENYDSEDGKDDKLIEKLLDLKKLTVESNLPHYSICKYRKYEFKEPKKYLKRQEEIEAKRRHAEEEIKRQIQKQQQEQEQLQRQKEKEELEKQNLPQRGKLDTNELLSNRENVLSAALTHEIETEQSFGTESPRGEGYRVMQEYARPSSFYSERLRTQKEQLEQTKRGYGGFKDETMDTSTTSGITATITDTISGFIKEVDPAPVLGVSGGMGVLFILFKYTPFGSFFGGRRGRFRQIPRTFGGFPPGDFGHFQEYGGGYVGYSQMDMPFQGE